MRCVVLALISLVAGLLGIMVFLWSCTDFWRVLAEEDDRTAALAAWTDAMAYKTQARERIAREVIAGRRSLVQGAACFRVLNQISADHMPRLRAFYPGCSDEECLCLQVIARVEAILTVERPEQAEGIATRLRAELEAELRLTGKIHLPEPRW